MAFATQFVTQFSNVTKFTAEGVLFDMDGTLTDSIAAVEAAWTAKALELGLEPEAVIAATHGRRASDNLVELVPDLRKEDIDYEVERFEKSILAFADTPPLSRKSSFTSSRRPSGSRCTRPSSVTPMTPVTPVDNLPSGFNPHLSLGNPTDFTVAFTKLTVEVENGPAVRSDQGDNEELEEEIVDMRVKMLPGVQKVIESLPEGKYAVATSGARTYCHGCLTRTGIKIPNVCVTADDPRLLRGKPFPDPFLLAAADLGVNPTRSVIFEDSPSGIKAAVDAGATVIAVCTSHKREQIEQLGAHFVVDTMDQVQVSSTTAGELEFTVCH